MEQNKEDRNIIISYLTLRKIIGILGIALPFILVIGSFVLSDCCNIRPSISHYYYTIMRNALVGILCVVAFFLFSYRGYEKIDHVFGVLAFVFALGIAFFPTSISDSEIITGCTQNCSNNEPWVSVVHFTSATLFFIVLSIFSLFLFTKTDNTKTKTKEKIKRNRLYKVCGVIMLASLALIAIWLKVLDPDDYPQIAKYNPVFWLETIALTAFGTSWLTKGELIWKDKKENN